jgi:hypothetical protein
MANEINTAIAAVETAIALIQTGSGYNYDLGSTEYIGPEAVDQVTGTRPRVYILSVADDVDRFSTSKLYRRATVTIRGIMDSSHYRNISDVTKLWADIEKALYSDKTLGGAVSTLRYLNGASEFQRESNHPLCDLVFELDIHYTEGTP